MPGGWIESVEEMELIGACANAVGVDEGVAFQSTNRWGRNLWPTPPTAVVRLDEDTFPFFLCVWEGGVNGLCFPTARDGTIIFSGCRIPRHSFTLHRRLASLAALAIEIHTKILTPSTSTFGTTEKKGRKNEDSISTNRF